MAEAMPASAVKSNPASRETPAGDFRAPLVQAHEAALSGGAYRLAPDTFLRIWGSRYSREELHETVAPERTLARRVAKHEPLTVAETDRAIRLARVTAETERVFADPGKAARWLRRPNGALGGQTPLSLLKSEAGARAIDEILIRIDHGLYG
jgi:putative toxin-antitoxin system antitoxin component (TIGR02293 family)